MLLCFQGSAFQAASPRSYMRERLGGVKKCIKEIMVDGVELVRQWFINCHAFSLRVSKSPLTWVLTPPSLSRPKRSLELPGHNHAHQHWGLIHAPRKCANHPNLQAAKVSRQPGNGWDDKWQPSENISPFERARDEEVPKKPAFPIYIYIN